MQARWTLYAHSKCSGQLAVMTPNLGSSNVSAFGRVLPDVLCHSVPHMNVSLQGMLIEFSYKNERHELLIPLPGKMHLHSVTHPKGPSRVRTAVNRRLLQVLAPHWSLEMAQYLVPWRGIPDNWSANWYADTSVHCTPLSLLPEVSTWPATPATRPVVWAAEAGRSNGLCRNDCLLPVSTLSAVTYSTAQALMQCPYMHFGSIYQHLHKSWASTCAATAQTDPTGTELHSTTAFWISCPSSAIATHGYRSLARILHAHV